ncbi:MAG: helix-turn-helix domain-containing protein [Edaphobacter sp.]|uniref:helix-turn-helix domain-containing protein n=1 Tax=Edaphobacter sp. TaxID=1934404 RepID=UPI00239DB9B8|nr:helix-turn-helix domain-containing protein [Edaphobacter sp.]MDE1178004.1 helix-turn-helix domain-containing protein [Edaphobacter sp.]
MEPARHSSSRAAWSASRPPTYRYVSDDPNKHADNLVGWSQLYDQLSVGGFSGEIIGACFHSIHLFRETTNLSLRQSCVVRSNGWWFGIPVSENDSFRVDSRRVDDGAIAIRRGHQPFELITPSSFHIFGLVIGQKTLAEHLRSVLPEEDALACLGLETMQAGERAQRSLRHLFGEILGEIQRRPEVLQSAAACESIQNSVLEAVTDLCVSVEHAPETPRSEIQHSQIVRSVRQFLLDNSDRAISVPELCSVFNVSRRTLQYAFDRVLGIGPNAYLKILRLNGVRRDLCRKEQRISVQQAASDWGFWHLSQFAKDYRTLFDELPSATVKRTENAAR